MRLKNLCCSFAHVMVNDWLNCRVQGWLTACCPPPPVIHDRHEPASLIGGFAALCLHSYTGVPKTLGATSASCLSPGDLPAGPLNSLEFRAISKIAKCLAHRRDA